MAKSESRKSKDNGKVTFYPSKILEHKIKSIAQEVGISANKYIINMLNKACIQHEQIKRSEDNDDPFSDTMDLETNTSILIKPPRFNAVTGVVKYPSGTTEEIMLHLTGNCPEELKGTVMTVPQYNAQRRYGVPRPDYQELINGTRSPKQLPILSPENNVKIKCPFCKENDNAYYGYDFSNGGLPYIFCEKCSNERRAEIPDEESGRGVFRCTDDSIMEFFYLRSGENLIMFVSDADGKYMAGERDFETNDWYFRFLEHKQNDLEIWSNNFFGMVLDKLQLPLMLMEFDFSSNARAVFKSPKYQGKKGVINLYNAPKILRKTIENIPEKDRKVKTVKDLPKYMGVLLRNNFSDDRELDYWLNQLSYIRQRRKKVPLANLFWGPQGSGKDTIFNHIIIPIFGEKSCKVVSNNVMRKDFKAPIIRNNIFVYYDEAEVDLRKRGTNATDDFVKQLITSNFMMADDKRERSKMLSNNVNLILSSNIRVGDGNKYPIILDHDDRRVSVFLGKKKLDTLPEWIEIVKKRKRADAFFDALDEEIEEMNDFLLLYPVDEERAFKPLYSQAKEALKPSIQSDEFKFFSMFIPSRSDKVALASDIIDWLNNTFDPAIDQIKIKDISFVLSLIEKESKGRLSRPILHYLYEEFTGKRVNSREFTKILDRYGLKDSKYNTKMTPGIEKYDYERLVKIMGGDVADFNTKYMDKPLNHLIRPKVTNYRIDFKRFRPKWDGDEEQYHVDKEVLAAMKKNQREHDENYVKMIDETGGNGDNGPVEMYENYETGINELQGQGYIFEGRHDEIDDTWE